MKARDCLKNYIYKQTITLLQAIKCIKKRAKSQEQYPPVLKILKKEPKD